MDSKISDPDLQHYLEPPCETVVKCGLTGCAIISPISQDLQYRSQSRLDYAIIPTPGDQDRIDFLTHVAVKHIVHAESHESVASDETQLLALAVQHTDALRSMSVEGGGVNRYL